MAARKDGGFQIPASSGAGTNGDITVPVWLSLTDLQHVALPDDGENNCLNGLQLPSVLQYGYPQSSSFC